MNGSAQNGGDEDRSKDAAELGLSERRAQLDRKLMDRQVAEETARQASRSSTSGYAQAMKLSSEFIAGVVVGGGIGWVADQWLGTSPFGLIVFLLLGFLAGVLNVLRAAGYVSEAGPKADRTNVGDDGPN